MFNHQDVTFESLTRETIDGVRYYKVPGTDKLVKLRIDYIGDQLQEPTEV